MLTRVVVVAFVHVLVSTVFAVGPSCAGAPQPAGYRILLEAQPMLMLRSPIATSAIGEQAGSSHGSDTDLWKPVLMAYKPVGPVFQLVNSATRLCLQPVRVDSLNLSVRQDVCGVVDTVLWYISEANGNYRLSLASDPSFALYGDTASPVPVALLGRIGDQPRARWIFRRF